MAQLRVTPRSLACLLGVTASQRDFILSSLDGSTTLRVELVISSVTDATLTLGGDDIVLDWSRSTIAHGVHRASLTPMELRLLGLLVECAPRPASAAI